MVLKVIVGDLQPFSFVEDRYFKELVNHLAPNYTIPCRTTFSRSLMPRKYEEMKAKLVGIIGDVESLALTTDIWTARTTQAYISLTGHYITSGWEMSSI